MATQPGWLETSPASPLLFIQQRNKDILPFKEWSVETEQIEIIISDLDETLNMLSRAYDKNIHSKDLNGLEDSIDFVMDAIREELKRRRDWL